MKWFRLACLLFLIVSCRSPKQEPDKGVSLALNEQRKRALSEVSYDLQLDIPAEKSAPITGNVVISFSVSSLTSDLVIDFNTDSTHVKSVRSAGEAVGYVFVNEHIVVEQKFLKEGRNQIEIEFIAGDLSLNRNQDYLYTLFVPDRAATCFPLFDQPNLKATYEITLTTPPGWEAVSNGALKEMNSQTGKTEYVFEKTKPISSYLVAFAAGKFFKTSRQVHDRTMTMYYRETDSAKVQKNLDEIFDLHGKSLAWLEDYTAIDYPFGKFDFVLIPSFQYGGMEHPGSIFYNESAMVLDEKVSVNRKMGRASLIAHETAHMWFGDLVTMDWFNDVWMKEVFANFMAAKIVQPSFPEINHNLRFLLGHYPSAYEVDRSAGANPILQPLDNLKNAGSLYGAIIYQKAPIVMRHLERQIGPDLMRASLQEYLKTYSFRNATWDDLISIIDANSPDNIEAWSKVWVKTPGMPVYDWDVNGLIKQEQDTISNRVWQQLIKIQRTELGDTTLRLVSEEPIPVKASSSYNYLNPDGFSYGYFKLDEKSKNEFLSNPVKVNDPVFRAAMWINCWESMVRAEGPVPELMIESILLALKGEADPLLIDFLLGYLQTAWWTFLPEHNRALLQDELERVLWQLVERAPDAGKKNSYFRTFRNLVISEQGLTTLEHLWNDKLKVKDLILSEEDKITLAYELALKQPARQQYFLQTQLSQTKNPDRKEKMQFVIPALSDDEVIRESFFESLKQEANREHEPWVLEALHYLHHPLRAQSSMKYLRPSLDLLQEIQLTGDIFFPQRWLQTTFSGYSSKEAAAVVDSFLSDNPGYPLYLKNKVLQSTDALKRSVVLQNAGVESALPR
ncbi:MAG: M1 family aminopeptidase [Cyclobacteriaceae bacterium]